MNEDAACRLRLSAPTAPRRPDAATDGDLANRLQRLVAELVPDTRSGLGDNWFDLGLTSVDLPLLAQRITSDEKVEVTLVDLMRYPSITALAAALADRDTVMASPARNGGAQ